MKKDGDVKIEIKNPDLLKEAMRTGINFFTGAGFSRLPNPDGTILPDAAQLCNEIIEKFRLPDYYQNDLESACAAVTNSQELQKYLRERFTLTTCNSMYNVLNKIKIKSFITTNIDNILYKVIDAGKNYYISDITTYGEPKDQENTIVYIPLHGSVSNSASKLCFSKFEVLNTEQANHDLFHIAYAKLRERPTLFCGYGFHDAGVLTMIKKILAHNGTNIWVQCLPNDKKNIDLFERLGCNSIKGDTASLLSWIDENILPPDNTIATEEQITDLGLKKYSIPRIDQIESISISKYYQQGVSHWHPILSNKVLELPEVNEMHNALVENKNIILVGTPFSGKTTALKQLAQKINAKNKLFIENSITPEEASLILKKINGKQTHIFFDKCAEDIRAYKIFANAPHIKVAGTAEDYQFETTKHLLAGLKYVFIEMKELTQVSAEKIYNTMPEAIRKDVFSYKESSEEKYSFLEFGAKNVKNVLTKPRIKKILSSIRKGDSDTFEMIALTSYLLSNYSALSTDILFSYFSLHSYDGIQSLMKKAKNLLRDYDLPIYGPYKENQDYFDLRSKLFAIHVDSLMTYDPEMQPNYAKVIEKFIYKVNPYKIFHYHVFRRKAYDSELFARLFNTQANKIYDFLYQYDKNPYTLQQWALCRAKLGDYTNAFIDIDEAINKNPHNFSIRNSQAIILFEANKDKKTDLAISQMKEAMEILRDCYTNDKRKIYHAQKFAEFAIHLANIGEKEYLENAFKWLYEIIKKGEAPSHRTKDLYNTLKRYIS